jgi:hypothetical protein
VVLDYLFSNLRHFTYIISFFRNFRIDFLNNASLATTCCYAKSGQKREQSLRQESLNLIPCGDFSDWHKVVLFDVDIDKVFAKRGILHKISRSQSMFPIQEQFPHQITK